MYTFRCKIQCFITYLDGKVCVVLRTRFQTNTATSNKKTPKQKRTAAKATVSCSLCRTTQLRRSRMIKWNGFLRTLSALILFCCIQLRFCGQLGFNECGQVICIAACKIRLLDLLGCVFINFCGVIGCLWSFILRNLHPCDPAEVSQAPTYIPAATAHWLTLFMQSHLVAFSAALLMVWLAPFFLSPVMPILLRALQNLCSRTLLTHSLSSSLCLGTFPPVSGTCCISSQCLFPGYCELHHDHVWSRHWWWSSLAWVMSLRCALETQVNMQLPVGGRREKVCPVFWVLAGFLLSFQNGDPLYNWWYFLEQMSVAIVSTALSTWS